MGALVTETAPGWGGLIVRGVTGVSRQVFPVFGWLIGVNYFFGLTQLRGYSFLVHWAPPQRTAGPAPNWRKNGAAVFSPVYNLLVR